MRKSKKLNPDDFKHLLSKDVEQMEARFDGASIYKYFHFPDPEILAEFLSRPTIKFAHKDDLEDPFELSKRWEQFGCPLDEEMFDRYVRRPLHSKLSDVGMARKKLTSMAKERMPWLSRQERRKIISSKVGRYELSAARNEVLVTASFFEAEMPNIFRDLEIEFIEEFAKTTGILSLAANSRNLHMWRKYAADGCGFVLEYNAAHEFFEHVADDGSRRKLIRPVHYRDDTISNFWENPYYLFLVKGSCWAFEEEWRVIRALDECQKRVRADGKSLYLVEAPPNLITSIIFGYNASSESIEAAVSRLRVFDSNIKFRRANLGRDFKVGIDTL